jgi:hypothetical protein
VLDHEREIGEFSGQPKKILLYLKGTNKTKKSKFFSCSWNMEE